MDRAALDKHATRQLGLFTRAQARDCGFTNHQINRRRRDGDWVDVRRDVFAERGLMLAPTVHDMAVLLALPGAVLTGPSAMRWHEVEVPATGTFVLLDRRRPARLPGVTMLREPVPAPDVCFIGGVGLTTLERAVFDCVRVLPDVVALAVLAEALEQGWSTLPQLTDRAGLFTNRRGAPRVVRLLHEAAQGSRAAAGRLAVGLFERSGIYGWEQGVPIFDRWGLVCIGDLVFHRPRLVIELSGRRGNRDRLLAAGWTVLSFSWHDLSARPDDVVSTTLHALHR